MAGKNTINGRLVRIYCCFAIPLAIIRKKHRPFLFHGGIGSRTRRGVSFCMGKASDRRPKGKEPEKRRGRKRDYSFQMGSFSTQRPAASFSNRSRL